MPCACSGADAAVQDFNLMATTLSHFAPLMADFKKNL